ncbi:hypothetical protein ACRRTK_006734 [Alexandromys fortis]
MPNSPQLPITPAPQALAPSSGFSSYRKTNQRPCRFSFVYRSRDERDDRTG